ncbi:hypothetical protein [Alkalithermobacter paradoxus]|uniref:Uncharacterized protein n=1 Tax=Alkalithermobacter paradoxus TaxID=29349 RepID=A0A1V4I859_9FIRM|nr:hypothetical protein CLOTH_12620 [[Clostridium] thermoalcaliphilum]
MKKKLLVLGLSFCMILFSNLSSFALQLNHEQQNENIITGVYNIDDSQSVISEALTFEEIVEMIAVDNNISLAEAEKQVIESFNKNNNFLFNKSSISPYNATYRTVSSSFTVTSEYKPSLKFYCQTSEGGYFWGIVKILNVGMDRNYKGLSKQFAGTVFTHLENAGRIFWIVNGDFFNNGTTTVNGGVEIKINESATINFGVSSSSNHYKYVYTQGYYNIR